MCSLAAMSVTIVICIVVLMIKSYGQGVLGHFPDVTNGVFEKGVWSPALRPERWSVVVGLHNEYGQLV